MSANSNNKVYNKTIAPLWESKFGGFYTMVNDNIMDAFQGVEKGGMLVIRKLKPESRKQETSPHAYLEFKTKAQLDAERGSGGGARNNSKASKDEEL